LPARLSGPAPGISSGAIRTGSPPLPSRCTSACSSASEGVRAIFSASVEPRRNPEG
jgi:hypothetical protein